MAFRDGRKETPNNYPRVIKGRRLSFRAKSIIEPEWIPSPEQLVEVAVEAVKFTQKCNIGHRGFMVGKQLTAGPESGKNGSVFMRLTSGHKAEAGAFMRRVLSGEGSELDRAFALGVYVTSEKRKATPNDINGIGVVLADQETARIAEGFVSRDGLDELPGLERQQFGQLLVGVEAQADAAFMHTLLKMAR